MKALSSSHEGRKYLLLSRSSETSSEEMKASRDNILPLFHDAGIERALFDYRKLNFQHFSPVEIDTMAKEFKADFPFCYRVALLCQADALQSYQALQSACGRYDIEVQLHSELESAKTWLCA